MTYNKLNIYLPLLLFFQLFFISYPSYSSVNNPFYVGILGGMGSTTWKGLVPSQAEQNLALNMSTPIEAQEGGHVWGGIIGFEVNPFFAFQANYIHYPTARVFFDSISLFSFNHFDLSDFTTRTESISFLGKVMLIFPDSKLRLFSSAGAGMVHRQDMIINDNWHLGPSFEVGLNYPVNDRIMAEVAGNYVAGFGESQLNPTDAYFPFLYSVSIRLAYCF